MTFFMVKHLNTETFDRKIIFVNVEDIVGISSLMLNSMCFNLLELRNGKNIAGDILQECNPKEIVEYYNHINKFNSKNEIREGFQ